MANATKACWYNSYEQANSIKKCLLPIKQTTLRDCGYLSVGCYTLHGSLTSPYKAGFLTSGSSLLFPFSYCRTMGYRKVAPLLQWPDRSGLSPDSLFWLLRGIQSALHMFNMELYWHYNNISVVYCQLCLILFSQFYEPDVTSPVIFREAFCHDIIYFFVCSCIFSVSVLYLFIFFTQAGTKRTSPFQTPWIPQSLRDLLRLK